MDYLAKNYTEAKQQANSVNVAFMPTVAPGYNDTAVRKGHPGRGRYFTDKKDSKPGDIFKAMIKQAALPNLDSRCDNIMMVTSFNEWYEDSRSKQPQAIKSPPTRMTPQLNAITRAVKPIMIMAIFIWISCEK